MTATAMTPAAAQTTPRGAMSAMLAGNFVIGMGVLAPAAMANAMIADLSVDPARIGALVSYGALVLCVGAPLLAFLTRALDRRLVLIAALALYGFGHIVSAFAPNFETLLAIRLVMIVGAAVFTPQAAATIGLLVGPDRRAEAVTFIFLGWSLASSFGMLAMTLGASAFGWRIAYEALGALALAAAVAVFVTLPGKLQAPALPLSAWGKAVSNPAILTVVSVTALTLAGQFALFPFLAPELKTRIGADPTQIAVLLSLYGFSGLIGASIATRLVARFGAPTTQALCLVTITLGLTLWALIARDVWTAGIAIAVWGFSFSAANGLQQARLITIDPAAAAASVSFNTSAIYIGQAIGAAIGVALIASHGDDLMAPVGVAFLVCAIGASVAAQRWFKA